MAYASVGGSSGNQNEDNAHVPISKFVRRTRVYTFSGNCELRIAIFVVPNHRICRNARASNGIGKSPQTHPIIMSYTSRIKINFVFRFGQKIWKKNFFCWNWYVHFGRRRAQPFWIIKRFMNILWIDIYSSHADGNDIAIVHKIWMKFSYSGVYDVSVLVCVCVTENRMLCRPFCFSWHILR